MLSGILAIIAGILIAANPGDSAVGLAVVLGAFALVFGIMTIVGGFMMRKAGKDVEARV